MQAIQVRINNLPLVLVGLEDGTAMIVPAGMFQTIICQQEEGVTAIFEMSGFSLYTTKEFDNEEKLVYNVPYQLTEGSLLKKWLVQQNMTL